MLQHAHKIFLAALLLVFLTPRAHANELDDAAIAGLTVKQTASKHQQDVGNIAPPFLEPGGVNKLEEQNEGEMVDEPGNSSSSSYPEIRKEGETNDRPGSSSISVHKLKEQSEGEVVNEPGAAHPEEQVEGGMVVQPGDVNPEEQKDGKVDDEPDVNKLEAEKEDENNDDTPAGVNPAELKEDEIVEAKVKNPRDGDEAYALGVSADPRPFFIVLCFVFWGVLFVLRGGFIRSCFNSGVFHRNEKDDSHIPESSYTGHVSVKVD